MGFVQFAGKAISKNLTRIVFVEDAIVGWSEAVRILIDSYYSNEVRPGFENSGTRASGIVSFRTSWIKIMCNGGSHVQAPFESIIELQQY